MINKPLDKIEEKDLIQLIQNSVAEGKTIEYKRELPDNSDSGKKEFLADVSSFANTVGGDLIFGIEESNGIPVKIEGLNVANIDEVKGRLDNMILDGIEPRIRAFIHPISLQSGKQVLIIRIDKSWICPHRVIYQGHDKFYARNSTGKYPLDTMELRTAFNLSETLAEKIKKFRIERIAELVADKTPVPFCKGGKIVLHLIPLESFSPNVRFDIVKTNALKPIHHQHGTGLSGRYTFEGILNWTRNNDIDSYPFSYIQVYRNGILEAVDGFPFRSFKEDQKFFIYPESYEEELLKLLSEYLNFLKELGVSLPIYCFLSLTGIEGYEIYKHVISHGAPVYKIDRNVLSLPEAVIENFDVNSEDILRPMFDLIWNACGLPKSENFDESGKWHKR